jgi:hypothetical protein
MIDIDSDPFAPKSNSRSSAAERHRYGGDVNGVAAHLGRFLRAKGVVTIV